MDKNIRISYLRDPSNLERVMTLAIKRDEESKTLSYAYAINRPSEWVYETRLKDWVTVRRDKGDQFCKSMGRDIALGRLASKPVVLPLTDQSPKLAVLEALKHDKNGLARRIADEAQSWEDTCQRLEQLVEMQRKKCAELTTAEHL